MSAKIPPKPTKDVIYVDVDDEITGIIDKVENSSHKVVALVLPKRAASLQSIVNMKLLKRSADGADKNVVLITSEHALLPLAGAAGLHVARNLQSTPEIPEAPTGVAPATAETGAAAEAVPGEDAADEELPKKFDYSRPIGALAARHEAENPETIDLDDEADSAAATAAAASVEPAKKKLRGEKLKVPNFDRFRMLLGLGAVALVALIVFIILALFVLPKATITVHTTSEPVTASFNMNASPGAKLDPAAGTIPSKLESSDLTGSQTVNATGQQNNGQKASGSVTMSVCVTGSTPSDVPAGTGVSTGGLTYVTQQAAHFGPTFQVCGGGSGVLAKSNSVSITATQAGSKYNGSISSAAVSGTSDSADGSASGGTDDIVTVLSQSDVDGAKAKITSSTSANNFTQSFEQKLASQGEYVLTSTLKAGDPQITSNPSVGQPASTATVNVKITYTVIALQKSDLSQYIQAKLESQIDKTKQKLSNNFISDASINVASQGANGAATLSVNEDTTAVPIIDVAMVKQVSAGKKVGDIQSAIGNWPGVKSVDVKLSPFWVSKVPSKTSKITVNVQEDRQASSNNSNSAP